MEHLRHNAHAPPPADSNSDAQNNFKIHTDPPIMVDVPDTDQEQYWFSLVDTNGDGRLDGNELLGTMAPVTAYSEGHDHDHMMTFGEAMTEVDMILREDDLDGDGYISYHEFHMANAS
jgi:Ca2+-binding EF-hand superfamily protein